MSLRNPKRLAAGGLKNLGLQERGRGTCSEFQRAEVGVLYSMIPEGVRNKIRGSLGTWCSEGLRDRTSHIILRAPCSKINFKTAEEREQ